MPVQPESYTLEQAEEDIATLRGDTARLGEYVELGPNPDVAVPDAGNTALFSSGGQPNYINSSGLSMGLSGAQNAAFPNTGVTAAVLTDFTTATILANDGELGAVYEIDCWGTGTQGSTRQTLQFELRIGGTSTSTVTFGTTAFSGINVSFRWRCRGGVAYQTLGATANILTFIDCQVNDLSGTIAPGNNNLASAFSCDGATGFSKDTTTDLVLGLRAAWGSTTGAPTMTSRVSVFKRIA